MISIFFGKIKKIALEHSKCAFRARKTLQTFGVLGHREAFFRTSVSSLVQQRILCQIQHQISKIAKGRDKWERPFSNIRLKLSKTHVTSDMVTKIRK